MRPELPILSFFCSVLLVGLLPLHIQSRNVAILSLIAWLLVCNIIQGVNSVVWSGNTSLRSPVWCDIATKTLLGARIALPAACTCISVHLHTLSSSRDAKQRPHRTLFEFTLCVILPLMYMAFHTIVQDNRFDLAEDFGCLSSTFPSVPAIILVWIPPLILCITGLLFTGLALWTHTHRNPLISDRVGLSPRLISMTFFRPLLTATIISMLVFSATIVDIQARVMGSGGLQPWTSWSQVHADLSDIRIIPQSAHLDLVRIEATWWIIPVSSLAFAVMAIIGLVYCVQNDSSYASRSLGKWFRSTIFRQDSDDDTFIQSSRHFSSHIILKSPTPPLPVHLLTSGWDESLRPSQAAKLRPKPPALTCDIPVTPSTTSTPDSDASFKESTLTYLQSPTGREALELASLPSLAQISPPLPATTLPDHTDILSSPWPRPPSTVPTTPTKSISIPSPKAVSRSPRRHNRAPSLSSLTSSLSSSTISNSAYINDPDLYLHTVLTSPHRPPFQDAGVPTDGQTSSTRTPTRPRRMPSKESIVHKNLSSSMKRAAGRKKDKEYGEAIYMTVVQETQAF